MSETEKRSILVTHALPYANGSIHLGHMVESIQTDIWVRFQKRRGHECYFVCADDAHGTPIMIRAQQDKISPEQLISAIHVEHLRDYGEFSIDFDNFHSTHSDENRELSELIYLRNKEAGHIERRQIEQAYDPVEGMFLPDRYIKGECPRCGAADQYGDNCEACGATYSPNDLKNPVSVLSGATPERRESEHLFFKLPDFEDMLKDWTRSGRVQDEIANKLDEWFGSGLQAWDISRDAPYFGFQIPGETDKFFYVWVDAPIGYMASFRNFCERKGLDFGRFWDKESDTELYHFIGKDIAYFHTLFWPAMLEGAGFRKPTGVFCHGFLTVNGQKMSKSRGTFIMARTYLDHLDPDYFRYYIAAKLGDGIDDIDLNLDDFVARVNADLVGKIVNIASRCTGFLHKGFDDCTSSDLDARSPYAELVAAGESIAATFERRQYGRAVREIMLLADRANQYIDEMKPWVLAREPGHEAEIQQVCSTGINLFRVLMIYLAPIVPSMAARSETFLCAPLDWSGLETPLTEHRLTKFQPLIRRIETDQVSAIVDASRSAAQSSATQEAAEEPIEPIADEISIDEFFQVDLRVAQVLNAEHVDGADKLLRLTLSLGDRQRQVLSGIKSAYDPEQLIGRMLVLVANLTPRKMRFGTSEGMILCAGPGGSDLWLLSPDSGAKAGMRIR